MCISLLGQWNAVIYWWYRNDKGDAVNASYFHSVNLLTNTAVGAEVTHSFSTNQNTLTLGAQHKLDPLTTVKARVNNFGKASALIQHEWRPRSLFTISGEVDTKAVDKTAKVGLALALKPWAGASIMWEVGMQRAIQFAYCCPLNWLFLCSYGWDNFVLPVGGFGL